MEDGKKAINGHACVCEYSRMFDRPFQGDSTTKDGVPAPCASVGERKDVPSYRRWVGGWKPRLLLCWFPPSSFLLPLLLHLRNIIGSKKRDPVSEACSYQICT